MWVYLIIAILLILAIFKERQALGCPDIPDGKDCDNINGKAVKGTKPYSSDTNEELYDKISLAASYKDRFVFWRVALITSFIAAILVWFILYRRFPTEWQLVVLILVFTVVLYFTNSFYKFQLSDYVKRNIQNSVKILRDRYENFEDIE